MKARKSRLRKLQPLRGMPFDNLADLIKTDEIVDENGNRVQLFENHKAPQAYKYGMRIVPKGHKVGSFIYGPLPDLQDTLTRVQQSGVEKGLKDIVVPSNTRSQYYYLDRAPEPYKSNPKTKASKLYKQDVDTVFEQGVLTEHEKQLIEKALLARQEAEAAQQGQQPASQENLL